MGGAGVLEWGLDRSAARRGDEGGMGKGGARRWGQETEQVSWRHGMADAESVVRAGRQDGLPRQAGHDWSPVVALKWDVCLPASSNTPGPLSVYIAMNKAGESEFSNSVMTEEKKTDMVQRSRHSKIKALVEQLGLEYTLRSRGRPRKVCAEQEQ